MKRFGASAIDPKAHQGFPFHHDIEDFDGNLEERSNMNLRVGPVAGQKELEALEANDRRPTWIFTEDFVGRISILVKGVSAKDDYFGTRSRLFCFKVQGKFQDEWDGDDIEFGIWLKEPVARLPFGTSIAVSFVKVHPSCKWCRYSNL